GRARVRPSGAGGGPAEPRLRRPQRRVRLQRVGRPHRDGRRVRPGPGGRGSRTHRSPGRGAARPPVSLPRRDRLTTTAFRPSAASHLEPRGAAMDTRATVEDLLARIGTGDPEEIAAIYAEQVDWQLDWPEEELGGDVPWIRRRATRADVAEHYRALGAHHDASRAHAEVDQILVDGGEAVITGTIVNT